MPGAGFLPNLIAALMILFGLLLVLRAAGESAPLADIAWDDLRHAAPVPCDHRCRDRALYAARLRHHHVLMLVALLVLVERRNICRAGLYSVLVRPCSPSACSIKFCRAPLLIGPFGF